MLESNSMMQNASREVRDNQTATYNLEQFIVGFCQLSR
jgi:hypothetical protein